MNCLCRPSRIMSVRINLLDETEFIHEIKVSQLPPSLLLAGKHGQLFRFHPHNIVSIIIIIIIVLKSVLWPQKCCILCTCLGFLGVPCQGPSSSIFSAGPCDLANMQSVIIHTSIAAPSPSAVFQLSSAFPSLWLKTAHVCQIKWVARRRIPLSPLSLAGKNCADFARHLIVGIIVRANQINCCDSSPPAAWPGFLLFGFSKPLQNLVPIQLT